MPAKIKQLVQVVSYLRPPDHASLEAARIRAEKKAGHPISASRYVGQIIRKHLARLTAA